MLRVKGLSLRPACAVETRSVADGLQLEDLSGMIMISILVAPWQTRQCSVVCPLAASFLPFRSEAYIPVFMMISVVTHAHTYTHFTLSLAYGTCFGATHCQLVNIH